MWAQYHMKRREWERLSRRGQGRRGCREWTWVMKEHTKVLGGVAWLTGGHLTMSSHIVLIYVHSYWCGDPITSFLKFLIFLFKKLFSFILYTKQFSVPSLLLPFPIYLPSQPFLLHLHSEKSRLSMSLHTQKNDPSRWGKGQVIQHGDRLPKAS